MIDLTQKRIESIDILRGAVMILMALDHTRDFFHFAAEADDPLNLLTTSPVLFFTRWITHFCAPVFVFLSGVSIYLQGLRKTKKELSAFLIKRGLWLIFLEVAVVSLAWSFNPVYNSIFLGVIWAIGISMIILGLIIRFPYKFIFALGAIIVLAHNLLDIPESAPGFQPGFWWTLLHYGRFTPCFFSTNHAVMIIYPFVPWTGLMMLGYGFGKLFSPGVSSAHRRRKLNIAGISLILLFIVLRFSNLYGDPVHWSTQWNGLFTLLSFINVWKYPPSLLYMCITIGPALLVLAWLENSQNRFTNVIKIYGRVALFYYVIHLYVIHVLSAIGFFMRGHTMHEAFHPESNFPSYFSLPGDGYHLITVYFVWIGVVVALFPLCRWYDRYKTSHKKKWWLSYL